MCGDDSLDKFNEDITPIRLFSLYEIQKALGLGSTNNHTWLREKITEIQETLVVIDDKKNRGDFEQFHIIDFFSKSEKNGGKYCVILSPEYSKYFAKQYSLGNRKQFLKMISLGLSPQSKALARYFFASSRSFDCDLEKAMRRINISRDNMNERTYRANKETIIRDADKLKEIGLEFEKVPKWSKTKNNNYTIKYCKPAENQVKPPLKNPTE